MNFLKNLKIKNKLRIPVILQLILIVVFVYFFLDVQSQLSDGQASRKIVAEISKKIRTLSLSIGDFLFTNSKKPYTQLEEEYQAILKLVNDNENRFDETMIDEFRKLGDAFKKVATIYTENNGIRTQVTELTDFSITQSNGFLDMISKKLVDKKLRDGVSDLERAVISGAALNTTANFNIKVLFLQVENNPSLGDTLTAFLEKILQNVEVDVKRLAGTPFAELPKKAKEANLKIKEMTTKFIANIKSLDGLKNEVQVISDRVLQSIMAVDFHHSELMYTLIKNIFYKLFAILLIFTLIIVVFGFALTRSIMIPLHAMLERAYDLAVDEVDMTRRLPVDSHDEFGELAGWFNKFLDRLHQLVMKVKQSGQKLHMNTEAIRQGSENLAARTSEQAASITETSNTLEQFTSAIQDNTENSAEADMMLQDFNAEMQEKSGLINNVTQTMTEIYDSSQQIDDIIRVINDISFQTNLLALNAAVEAARAGDAGRGFAVVAAEVRNLAQKTAESSKSIRQIVLRNVESTQKGMKLVEDTSTFFRDIVGVMGDIVTKISNITNVSREQATSITQISQTISNMEHVITENANLVQKLSNAGREVENNAEVLQTLTVQFKVNETDGIKGSDYHSEVLNNKLKTKKTAETNRQINRQIDRNVDKRTVKENEIKKARVTAPPVKKSPVGQDHETRAKTGRKTPPTEEDFFGKTDDEFLEF